MMAKSSERLRVNKTYKLFIGGKFTRSESGRYYQVTDTKGEFMANYCRASRKDFRNAMVAARAAVKGWSTRSAFNRGQILYRMAEMLESLAPGIEGALCLYGGHSAKQAEVELAASVDRLVWYSGWADKFAQVYGSTNPVATGHFNFTTPAPVGVVAAFVSRNSPLLGLVSALAPIIVSGNTVILVVENTAPIIALELGEILATSENSPYAAIRHRERPIWGLQFHPEVVHTECGSQILTNFVTDICGCSGNWTMDAFIDQGIENIRRQVGKGLVLCGLSGGVDSSVAAALVHRAVGDQMTCIFVDHGMMRLNERQDVEKLFAGTLGIKLVSVDASERFLSALKGVTEPEQKRRIIGGLFIDVFEEESQKLGNCDYLVQGTLYPDVIESVSVKGASATIKTHHNVGGLPDDMRLKLVEPLRELFKDEVREVGRALGLPESLVGRHPFPGPGLGIRILGEVTPERLTPLRAADAIMLEEIRAAGLYDEIWQAFAVLLPVQSVGVMGDARTYESVLALRAVTSRDGMTADWYPFPHEVLSRLSTRIINEVRGINRVVYDVTSKPPGTIEWE